MDQQPYTEEADPIEVLRAFIISRNNAIAVLPPDLDIIEKKVIDSLQLVDLIYMVEDLSNTAIDFETLNIDHFRSLEAIERQFFQERL